MNMLNPSCTLLLLSSFLTSASTIGGWALTVQVAGSEAGVRFLWTGGSFVIAILVVQIALCFLDGNRVLYRQLFGVAFSLALVWFMLCLFLPVFFIASVSVFHKFSIAIFFFFVVVGNFAEGFSRFDRKWKERGEKCFVTNYDQRSNVIDWQQLVKSMKLTVTLYVPGVPKRAEPVLAIATPISMVLGLNMWSTFPILGIFAWSIGSALLVSIFVQMIGLACAQAARVAKIEANTGKKIKALGREDCACLFAR